MLFLLLLMLFAPVSQTPVNSIKNDTTPAIRTKEDLIRFAEPILFKTYGKEKILGEKPYVISLRNGIWTMNGTLPAGYKGGTFFIMVKAGDGKIIKLAHYK